MLGYHSFILEEDETVQATGHNLFGKLGSDNDDSHIFTQLNNKTFKCE